MLELLVKIQDRLTADESERGDRGATAVEYGLMVALIAAAIVVTVSALGGGLSGLFDRITGLLGGG